MNDLFFYYLGDLAHVLDHLGAAVRETIKEKDPRPFGSDHHLTGSPISPAVGDDYRNSFGTDHSDKHHARELNKLNK